MSTNDTNTDSSSGPNLSTLFNNMLQTPEAQQMMNHENFQKLAQDSTFTSLLDTIKQHATNVVKSLTTPGDVMSTQEQSQAKTISDLNYDNTSAKDDTSAPTAADTTQQVGKSLSDTVKWEKAHAAVEKFNPSASQAEKELMAKQLFLRSM